MANIAVHKKRIKSGLLRDLMRNRALYTLAIPGLIWYVVFCYLPMAGIIIAFTKYNVMDGIFGSPFVGLDNFKFLINSRDLFQITYNTLFLNVLFIAFGLISQLSIAILLNEISSRMFKRVSQALMLLPFFVSWVLVGAISRYILGTDMGFANTLLKTLGLKPVSWYTSPQYWPVILTIASVWKGVGYGSIIYLAAIVGVDQEIYESAQLDGCSRPQLIRHITIPCVIPTISILFLLSVGGIFHGNFGMVYNMVGDNTMLFRTTNIIDTYVFRALRQSGGAFSMGAAAGFLQSALGFIAVLSANKLVARFDKDNALF